MTTVRTRVAPSPTGDPHVGTAYIALMNWLFAKKHGGQFILRVEDTDQVRSTPQSERMILEALRWLGLGWDEGPDVGGPHGPYRQSERTALYQEHAAKLEADGHAFKCYCTAERLDAMRKQQMKAGEPPRYDGRCLTEEGREQAKAESPDGSFVLRMKVPSEGVCTFKDELRDDPISIEWSKVDMQILMKSDGFPTYHMANVVDDHAMGITHVIRGEEWISSVPKHELLYQYLDWQPPKWAHLPLLRNADKSKLSKRKNPTSILFFQRAGYLPEALINFLGLAAKSASEGDEMTSLAELREDFALTNISLGGPVFDVGKLDWLNARYLRETMDAPQFLNRVREWALNEEYLLPIAEMAQSRVEKLGDLGGLVAMFFQNRLDMDETKLRDVKIEAEEQRQAYQLALWQFDKLAEWDKPSVEGVLRDTATRLDLKFKFMVRAFFIAITGSPTSVPLFEATVHLGRDIVRERLRHALEILGNPSKKELKSWEELLSRPLPEEA
ncbi:glutamate--tRNA ligase [Novosphingopyxis sp. YJ-S2-01]|uniref:glutamate--tRNA ligase n=1 Tax=Novosphingopyxis sp. YJ-S2-01 TaxID=2794021 RepID=UPI0018DB49EC|nr:glutamate--tRNA ligase [Novosphingopyxis sp. YJ-S2-01]MBH9537338.1 glutamate--tRNA ligase [Novosphingopyxis sp. YJ-S2-01]